MEPAALGEFVNEWFDEEEIEELESLSGQVDKLWALHTEQLGVDHRETEDPLPVWGQNGAPAGKATSNAWKDRIRAQGVLSEGTRTASPYRRLKLVMDYWCALWFWPIRESERLPSRQEAGAPIGPRVPTGGRRSEPFPHHRRVGFPSGFCCAGGWRGAVSTASRRSMPAGGRRSDLGQRVPVWRPAVPSVAFPQGRGDNG